MLKFEKLTPKCGNPVQPLNASSSILSRLAGLLIVNDVNDVQPENALAGIDVQLANDTLARLVQF